VHCSSFLRLSLFPYHTSPQSFFFFVLFSSMTACLLTVFKPSWLPSFPPFLILKVLFRGDKRRVDRSRYGPGCETFATICSSPPRKGVLDDAFKRFMVWISTPPLSRGPAGSNHAEAAMLRTTGLETLYYSSNLLFRAFSATLPFFPPLKVFGHGPFLFP